MIQSKLRTFVGILVPVLALTLAKDGASQPAGHPLVCRGGGAMSAWYEPTSNGSMLRVSFNKAPQGTNFRPLGPGECAWPDRPLNGGETPVLVLSSNEHVARWAIGNGGIGVEQATPGLGKLLHAILTGSEFAVLAGNDQGRSLVIHHVY